MTQALSAVQSVKVEEVIEAPWNVNVMDDETFKLLLADMKASGPEGISPIHTADVKKVVTYETQDHVKRVTIDGSHRLRAAQKLGWDHINEIFHPEIENEMQARLFNYRLDKERGAIDEFKLASSFKWFADKGVKQEQIAKDFNVDRSTVSKKISLLNLDTQVRQVLVEKEGLDVSHLEPIATLEPRLQKMVAANLHDYHFGGFGSERPTVKGIEHVVKDVKARDEAEQTWKTFMETVKFKKCPTCKRDAEFSRYQPSPKWLRCAYGHEWSPTTGKSSTKEAFENITHVGGQKVKQGPKRPRVWPQLIRSMHETEEYDAAYWGFFKDLWPKLASVEKVDLKGKLKDGTEIKLDYHWLGGTYTGSLKSSAFSYGAKSSAYSYDKDGVNFHVEEMTAPTLKKKGYKARVGTSQHVSNQKQLDAITEASEKFLAHYGKVPRGKAKAPEKAKVKKK